MTVAERKKKPGKATKAKPPGKAAPLLLRSQIRAIRKAKELTQAEAAARIGVSQSLWADWERGYRVPSPAHVILIRLLEQGRLL